MKQYRAIITPNLPKIDEGFEEHTVGTGGIVMMINIGDHSMYRDDPSGFVEEQIQVMGLKGHANYQIEEIPAGNDPFDIWLDKQSFGSPSRIPGRRILAGSTQRLMHRAWNAALGLPGPPPAGATDSERRRGDIYD